MSISVLPASLSNMTTNDDIFATPSSTSATTGNSTPRHIDDDQMDVSSIVSSEASPAIEPLHQGNSADSLEMQRILLQQKLADHAANAEKFSSPTDNMMSPCTQKLQAHKKKQYSKGKPTLLRSAFAQVAAESQQSQEIKKKKADEGSPF